MPGNDSRLTFGDGAWLLMCAALITMLAATGCATVQPYERERLSRPDMIAGRDGDARAGQEHATAYREGSTGAVGSTGGGCGCN